MKCEAARSAVGYTMSILGAAAAGCASKCDRYNRKKLRP